MSLLTLLLSFAMVPSDTVAQSPMQSFLPSSIHQWQVSEPSRRYSGEEIFDYMNGAGEIYRAYDFIALLTQRYAASNQEEILVEIFDMGSPQNAFGVFTYMKGRGPAVQVGHDGEYKNGLLCFWRGKYFVCVMIEKENEPAKKAVLELGEMISDAIREGGERPAILRYLPEGEYLSHTLRYFTRHEILNIHFYVADGNVLHLNDETEGVLVRMKEDKSYLLLISYPDQEQADSAYADFVTQYMPDAREAGIVETENNKWTACARQKHFVVVVFNARTIDDAMQALEAVKSGLP